MFNYEKPEGDYRLMKTLSDTNGGWDLTCNRCGASVNDREAHNEFHRFLGR